MAGDVSRDQDPLSDEDLIRRIRDGDEAAFQAYCSRHAAALEARIVRQFPELLKRKTAASDILQDAWFTALRRLPDFEDRGEGSFLRWLFRIIDLKIKTEVRRHLGTAKRGAGREVPLADDGAERSLPARGPSPSQMAMAAELRDAARAALGRLPADYREVLRLFEEERLSIDAAAARLGRTRAATKKLYSRALARFAAILEAERKDRP